MAAARQVLSGVVAATLAAGLLAAPAAGAADPLVVGECTETAFRAAVAAAPDGATVTFGCDGTIALTTAGGGVIQHDRALTVDGTGRRVVLSGSRQTQLFFLGGLGSLTLRSLTVADGYAGDDIAASIGGAVRSYSPVVVDDVRFENNVALLAGGALAVQNGHGSLTVTRSTFVGNRASGQQSAGIGGGAIAVQAGGPTSIADSTFTGNTTAGQGSGGAFAALRAYRPSQTGPISISGSTFTDNVAAPTMGPVFVERQGGGAVSVHNRALTITGSTFTGNHARSMHAGGAVLVQSDPPPGVPVPPAAVSASTFTGNTAGGLGGGIVATVPLTVDGSSFLRNQAAQGGALAMLAAGTLTRSTVQENVGLGDDKPTVGGLVAAGSLTVSGTSFVDDNEVSCGRLGSAGIIVDGGGNTEAPGSSCGFGAPAATPTSTTLTALLPGTDNAVTSVQHTDRIDLRATVSSTATGQPVAGMAVSFLHDGLRLGAGTTDGSGVARLAAVQIEVSPTATRTPSLQAFAISTAQHLGSSGVAPLAVIPEDLVMGPALPRASAPGAIEVSARLSEPLDGSLGVLLLSGANTVDVVATPKGSGGTGVRHTCTTRADSALLDATPGAERTGCVLGDVPAGVYDVTLRVVGQRFNGTTTGELVVADPASRASAVGSGTLGATGSTFRLLAPGPGVAARKGTFHLDTGRTTVKGTISTGPVVTGSSAVMLGWGKVGGKRCTFRIEVVDRGRPTRTRTDTLGLQTTCGGTVSTDPTLSFGPTPLSRGDLLLWTPRSPR